MVPSHRLPSVIFSKNSYTCTRAWPAEFVTLTLSARSLAAASNRGSKIPARNIRKAYVKRGLIIQRGSRSRLYFASFLSHGHHGDFHQVVGRHQLSSNCGPGRQISFYRGSICFVHCCKISRI